MKRYLLNLFIFCFSISQHMFGQTPEMNLNTLIKPSASLVNETLKEVKVTNVATINTAGIEYSAVYYKNGIVFSSDRYLKQGLLSRWLNNNNSNIYFTGISENGQTYEPVPVPGEINSKRHEGSATFSSNGNVMIYTRNCNQPSNNGYYELKLSSAYFEKGQWVDNLDLPFNDGYRTCHPALSKNGRLLIFASNRPSGLGGMDLYASEYINGEWTVPYNLGQEVNSSGDEVFPFLDADGTLYFASNGRPGMGGLDIFKATQNASGTWGETLRFPEPFNSRWDDFSFVTNTDLQQGFFSSNRPGGKGLDDIYSWKITPMIPLEEPQPEEKMLTHISVIDEHTGLPMNDAQITLIQINPELLQTGYLDEPISIVNKLNQNVVELLGKVIQPIENNNPASLYPVSGNQSYLLIAKQEGQKPFQQLISSTQLTADNKFALVFPTNNINSYVAMETLSPLAMVAENTANEFVVGGLALMDYDTMANPVVITENTEVAKEEELFTAREIPEALLGNKMLPLADAEIPEAFKVLSFNNLYHEFNDVDVAENELVMLANIITEMKRNESFHLTIKSHTDQRGTSAYNLALSQKRAMTVMEKLIQGGISAERLSAVGLGEAYPIQDCLNEDCSEMDHKLNRRTEFVISRQKSGSH